MRSIKGEKMADNTLPTPTNNDVPSTDIRDHVYAGAMLDKAMTGTALTYTDRKGGEHDTWPGIEKKSADKLSELDNIITSLDTANFTFSSVAAGIAGTTDGQYFRVPQGATADTSFIYYKNESGAATSVAITPGMESVRTGYLTSDVTNAEITNGLVILIGGSTTTSANFAAYFVPVNAGDTINFSGRVGSTQVGQEIMYLGQMDSNKNYVSSLATYVSTGSSTVAASFSAVATQDGYAYVRVFIGSNFSITKRAKNLLLESDLKGALFSNFSRIYSDISQANGDIVRGYIPDGSAFFLWLEDEYSLAQKYENVSGVATPTGLYLPNSVITDKLKNLIRAVNYIDPDEFEFAGDVLVDENRDVIRNIAEGEYKVNLPVVSPSVKTELLTLDGRDVSKEDIPTSDFVANLSPLVDSVRYLYPDEFEFAEKVLVLIDEDRNIFFDVEEYLVDSAKWNETTEEFDQLVSDLPSTFSNPVIPFSDIDVSGKKQVYVFNQNTSTQTRVTDGVANETNPHTEGVDKIVWESDRTDLPAAPGGLYYANISDLKPYSAVARKCLVAWGHSFMQNPRFMNRLFELTGLPSYNFGLSSLRSTSIAARQGGEQTYYFPEGGVIPADTTPVNLTPNVPGPLSKFTNTAAASLGNVVLAGVEGTLSWSGSQASFTRTTAGEAVNVAEETPLYCRPFTTQNVTGSVQAGVEFPQHDECINLFWLGRNNIASVDTIVTNAINMVNYLKNMGKKVVILPDFNSGSESSGTAGYNNVIAVNSALKSQFPDLYCELGGVDLRANFIAHGNPAYETDAQNMADDVPPYSLRYDSLHPSQSIANSQAPEYALYAGADVNADFVYQFLENKGWI